MEEDFGMELFDINLEDLGIEPEEQEEQDAQEEQLDSSDKDGSSDNDNDKPNEEGTPDEVVEEEEITEEEDPESSTGTESPDLFKSLVTVLADEGVLSEVDSEKEIKSVNDVIDLVKKEINKQEYSDLTDLQKEALEAYRAGVPVERFNKQVEVKQRLDSITDATIDEDENLRKQLIYQDFKAKGFSEEKATKLTNRSFDADDDVEDAKSALLTLKANLEDKLNKEKEDLVKEQEDRIKADKQRQEGIKKKIFSTDEIIKGYKVNEGLKKKIYGEIYNPTYENPDTGKKENSLMKFQRENPEEFMHKLYYMWAATKGFENFDYFKNKERSSGVRDLENAIRQSSHVRGGGDPNFLDDPNSFSIDLGDELVID